MDSPKEIKLNLVSLVASGYNPLHPTRILMLVVQKSFTIRSNNCIIFLLLFLLLFYRLFEIKEDFILFFIIIYYMSKKSRPILYSQLLYEMLKLLEHSM